MTDLLLNSLLFFLSDLNHSIVNVAPNHKLTVSQPRV